MGAVSHRHSMGDIYANTEMYLFEVKKDCIYSALSDLVVSRAGSEDLRNFLRSHHVHFDPLGVLCYLRSVLIRPEMISHCDTVLRFLDVWSQEYPNDFAGESKRVDLFIDLLNFLKVSDNDKMRNWMQQI